MFGLYRIVKRSMPIFHPVNNVKPFNWLAIWIYYVLSHKVEKVLHIVVSKFGTTHIKRIDT